MKSLLSPKQEPAYEAHRAEPPSTGSDTEAPGPLASFVRFVVCGGGIGVLSSAAVPLVATVMPWALANALITVASTLLCTELHSLFTFGTGRRAGLRRHLQSAGSATAAYAVTSAAILVLHTIQPSPTLLWEQTVYLTAAGLAGIGRFLVLRLFVFNAARGNAGQAQQLVPATSRRIAPRPYCTAA
ncbi:GtrA family protein [Streptomyces sp. GESEQ-35]|uniref:GtrA family protein n=1 Tax=Streptomyces sp. GESEQ-35 TaxID=2812657 RepID=UPI001FF4DC30|nr:GtrA family protein [Streptomyces sp. GESEQ-35]